MSKTKRHRSAVDGRYVTEDYARRNPRTTVSETQRKPKKPKK
ncbi:hypothetical protein [Marinobacter nauticus]|nr:hypothetical protein [Marinobacter nauticus]